MAYDHYRDEDLRDRHTSHRRGDDRDHDRERGFFRDRRDEGHVERSRHERDERRSHREDYGRNDRRAPIPTDETRDLIASSKVEGTPVYGRDDERLGSIRNLMIDKYRGQVRYAVLAHGRGFLGLDEQLFPVQWDELRFDEERGGYRVNFTAEDVRYTLERRQRQRGAGARDIDRDWRR